MSYSIYMLAHPVTGEARYVGKTVRSLARRFTEHRCTSSRRITRLSSWWKNLSKQGLEPTIHLIESHETEQELNDGEAFWIANLRSVGAKILNHTDGGEGQKGNTHSPETRAKLSALKMGKKMPEFTQEHKDRIGAANKGKKRTDEQNLNNSKSGMGRKPGIETILKMRASSNRSKPVIRTSPDGVVTAYPSMSEAGRSIGIERVTVKDCISKSKSFNGYRFQYSQPQSLSQEVT
jgi:group I intron endonuclease